MPENFLVPIVIPSYNRARRQTNLIPSLATILSRLGFPVLVHGLTKNLNRITSAEIFRELGIPWLLKDNLTKTFLKTKADPVFIPVEILFPKLFLQLNLSYRLGIKNSAHFLAKLITPFTYNKNLKICSVSHPFYISLGINFFEIINSGALLMQATEGEAYINSKCLFHIYNIRNSKKYTLLDPNLFNVTNTEKLPEKYDAVSTAY